MAELVLGRRLDRPDLEVARIPFGGEALDDAALPRRVPALEQDQRAALVDDMRDLDMRQPLLHLRQVVVIVAVIFGAGFVIREIDRHSLPFRHAGPVPASTAPHQAAGAIHAARWTAEQVRGDGKGGYSGRTASTAGFAVATSMVRILSSRSCFAVAKLGAPIIRSSAF